MKRILFLASLVLTLSACQKDDDIPPPPGGAKDFKKGEVNPNTHISVGIIDQTLAKEIYIKFSYNNKIYTRNIELISGGVSIFESANAFFNSPDLKLYVSKEFTVDAVYRDALGNTVGVPIHIEDKVTASGSVIAVLFTIQNF